MVKKSKSRQAPVKKDNEENIPDTESDQVAAETNITASTKSNDSTKVKKSKSAKTKSITTEVEESDSQNKKSLKRTRQSSTEDLLSKSISKKEQKKLKKSTTSEQVEEVTPTEEATPKQKKKKIKKTEKSEPSAEETATSTEAVSVQKKGKEKKVKPVSSYSLFVGSVPYSAEKEHLEKHFIKVAPSLKSVRLLKDKDSGQSRGIAFIEVCGEKDYQAALSLDKSFLMGRRINVEYTCAGSQKSKKRAAKIQAKNCKLKALQRRGIITQTAAQARATSREARNGSKK